MPKSSPTTPDTLLGNFAPEAPTSARANVSSRPSSVPSSQITTGTSVAHGPPAGKVTTVRGTTT